MSDHKMSDIAEASEAPQAPSSPVEELSALDEELLELATGEKEKEIARLRQTIDDMQSIGPNTQLELYQANAEKRGLEYEIESMKEDFRSLRSELDAALKAKKEKDREIAKKNRELAERDEIIRKLMEGNMGALSLESKDDEDNKDNKDKDGNDSKDGEDEAMKGM